MVNKMTNPIIPKAIFSLVIFVLSVALMTVTQNAIPLLLGTVLIAFLLVYN